METKRFEEWEARGKKEQRRNAKKKYEETDEPKTTVTSTPNFFNPELLQPRTNFNPELRLTSTPN